MQIITTQSPGRKPRWWPPRTAFTLVELLVVIAVIGVLVSLLLPAINGAREAARRIQCANNLRQLSLAVINYETANQMMPPPGLVGVNPEPSIAFGDFDPLRGRMISWIAIVLPYFEEQALYDQINFDRRMFEQQQSPQAVQLGTLMCPSDAAEGRFFVHPALDSQPFAKGNYAAWASPFHIDLQSIFPAALGGWGQKLKDITDGTSKTLVMSEVRTRANQLDQRGVWALPWNGASLLAYDVHHDFQAGGEYFPLLSQSRFAQRPNHQGPNLDTIYDCDEPAEAQLQRMPCGTYQTGSPVAYLSSAPRSGHSGGVNAAALDGHVRFIVNDVDVEALSYLISINDGQSKSQ